jgi:hypothetical protein
MKVISNLYLVLGVFCLGAGIILGLWGHEVVGTFYLVVLSVAFAYLAKESREYGEEPADAEEPDVAPEASGGEAADDEPQAHDVAYHASAPSLTPFLFAIGAGLIVSGLVFFQWLVLVGGATMAVVAIAWFIETGRRRAAEEAAKAGHGEHH